MEPNPGWKIEAACRSLVRVTRDWNLFPLNRPPLDPDTSAGQTDKLHPLRFVGGLTCIDRETPLSPSPPNESVSAQNLGTMKNGRLPVGAGRPFFSFSAYSEHRVMRSPSRIPSLARPGRRTGFE